jgi:hypothetical protein
MDNGKIVSNGSKIQKRLYKSNFSNHQPSAVSSALVAKKSPPFIQIWHKRLSHVNFSTRKKMNSEDYDDGLVINNSSDPPPFCEGCVSFKHNRLPFPTSGRARV